LPASRADHAARLLLSNMAAWDGLSHEDHAMLCELPAPHGPLFVWLDSQFHDQGPLAWGALREDLQGQAFEPLALKLMAGPQADGPGEHNEATRELRALLDLMQIDRLMQLEREALEDAATDPQALARYRSILERRRQLSAVRPVS
jgi:DNA primase